MSAELLLPGEEQGERIAFRNRPQHAPSGNKERKPPEMRVCYDKSEKALPAKVSEQSSPPQPPEFTFLPLPALGRRNHIRPFPIPNPQPFYRSHCHICW